MVSSRRRRHTVGEHYAIKDVYVSNKIMTTRSHDPPVSQDEYEPARFLRDSKAATAFSILMNGASFSDRSERAGDLSYLCRDTLDVLPKQAEERFEEDKRKKRVSMRRK